jgi:hypothetical protein
MAASLLIATRVTSETKVSFRALAERQGLTESALLKRMIGLTLQSAGAASGDVLASAHHRARHARLCIRLRGEDQMMLRERAAARQMAAATYASVLVRAHLRSLSPLPKGELLALKRSIAELASIGRNINQIARVANEGGWLPGSVREEFRAMLKICEALRDNTKALLKANVNSWEAGHAELQG